ncbi:RRQRL motif-containing zinc-binding protein [Streptomyces sp. NPDC051561]|uniref:RRQRL motif-containing zinc-binding protein n=1 Tax=Streptomyces sp. NPDC051561 TaxID=3365658 RepID=UPI0037B048CB
MAIRYGKCLATTPQSGAIPRLLWKCAPEGYATLRQLDAQGLRPGGQGVQIEVFRPRYRRGPLVAYLYRIDLAKPKRPMTPAKWAALAKANAARRMCPSCRLDAGYVIPASLGMCVPCAYPEEQRAA